MKKQNRRGFLTRSAALTGGAALAAGRPASARSSARTAGANDRIRLGVIGCGGRGRGDLRRFLEIDGIQCAAICDVDPSQLDRTQSEILDPAGQKAEFRTRDFRRLLDRQDLDAVLVATPDHWHAIPTVMACEAGMDVYVEKPLSLSIHEGRVMVDAARRHGRVVQMGTQQRSAPHYTDAVDYVKSGKLGKVRLVRAWAYLDWKGEMPAQPDGPPPPGVDYDMWLGPAPERSFNLNRFHFSFRWYWDYSGGLMTDWGAHMIDIANWAMDVKAPRAAVSVGGKFGYPRDAMQTPDTQQVIWEFDDFSMVWEHALGVGRGPEAREHGVQFHGNDGVLVVDRNGWEVHSETDRIDKSVREFRSRGKPRHNIRGRGAYHLGHVQDFVDCMRSRERPRSDVEIGHDSMIACHLGNIAYRLGRRVQWDPDRERIVDDPEAGRMVRTSYRKPWKL